MITQEELDKMWCSRLSADCDLKTMTTIAKKVQKQECGKPFERFGQWCRALIKACDDAKAGNIIATLAVKVWHAENNQEATIPAGGAPTDV